MEETGLLSRYLKTGKGFGYLTERYSMEKPEQTAIICGNERRTYGELEQHIRRLAGSLKALGLGSGSHAALILPNCIEYLEIEFACARLGVVPVKLNWRLAWPELERLVAFNGTDVVFYQGKLAEENGSLEPLKRLGILMIDASGDAFQRMREMPEAAGEAVAAVPGAAGAAEKVPEMSDEMPEAADGMDEAAGMAGAVPGTVEDPAESVAAAGRLQMQNQELMHLHTSGTTGLPKCVVYTQESLLAELDTCCRELGFDGETVFQVMSQLFHAACVGPYTCLSLGGTLILFSRFQPQEYLASIERERVTHLSAIPTVLRAMLDSPDFDRYDLSSLKTVYYSTCPIPPGLIEEASRKLGCGFFQSYGMTEMGSIVTVLRPGEHFLGGGKYLKSVGTPVSGGSVKVVSESGEAAEPGQIGEICLKGPGMMGGYYHMERETAGAIRDGWYFTGDMGYLDETGYLFLTGRKSDMIISGGENIYPKEIEDVIYCCPGVKEAAVYGAADAYWGEAVHAAVVLREGSRMTGEVLRGFLRKHLAGYKIPKKILLAPELPKNASGKICKRELPALEPEFYEI